jgi:hypothetical protein
MTDPIAGGTIPDDHHKGGAQRGVREARISIGGVVSRAMCPIPYGRRAGLV